MPSREVSAPRRMFPPPFTTATSTPSACASAISRARAPTASGSIVFPPGRENASPETFRRIRCQRAPDTAGRSAADLHADPGLERRPAGLEDLRHALRGLVGAEPDLLEEHGLLEEGAQLA